MANANIAFCHKCDNKLYSSEVLTYIFCKNPVHKKCCGLSNIEYRNFSNDNTWVCRKCIDDTFPFSKLDDYELHYELAQVDLNETLFELHEETTHFNFKPFSFTEYNEFSQEAELDPENNLFNNIDIDCEYFTDEQFRGNYKGNSRGLSIIHFNCRSMSANFDKIEDYLHDLEYKFDIIAISETWLSDNDDHDEWTMSGYSSYFSSRIGKRGGGVAIFVKNSHNHKLRDDCTFTVDNCMELVCIEITRRHSKNVLINCIYRSPGTDMNVFNDRVGHLLSKLNNKLTYMCGDFNIDLLHYESHNESKYFVDQLFSSGIYPLILRPTRVSKSSATLIDNIFTNELSTPVKSGLLINNISDHLPVFQISGQMVKTHQKDHLYIRKRKINEDQINKFKEALFNVNWNSVVDKMDLSCVSL